MSRITHVESQPKNILRWDYYILCHLNSVAAITLQKIVSWDEAEEDSNDLQTPDSSNWVDISANELAWKLMGTVSESKIPSIIDFLTKNLHYLKKRNNPENSFDRKKQYAIQGELLQEHINRLGSIIDFFDLPVENLKPVFYAIEVLTEEGVYISSLNIQCVLKKIASLSDSDKIPHFLKLDVEDFKKRIQHPQYRDIAETSGPMIGKHDGMDHPHYNYLIAKTQYQSAINNAKKLGQVPTLTLDEWIANLAAFNFACAYCQRQYKLLEHFIPLNHNGPTTAWNCVPSCYSCNNRKSGRLPQEIPDAWGMAEALLHVQQYLETKKQKSVDEVAE